MKMKTMPQIQQIENIMEHFDFDRVHTTMKRLKWTWRDNGVPTIPQLKKQARALLVHMVKHPTSFAIATGGFRVQRWGRRRLLQLAFEIQSYIATQDTWE